MIPANYLRAQMHKPVNPITQLQLTNAHLTAENSELRAENAHLKSEIAVLTAMQELIDAKIARFQGQLAPRQVRP